MQIMVMAKAKFHIFERGGKFIAQDPEGGEYTLTNEQYAFYQYIIENLQPKQLEIEF
jgi:hypothetical protein